MEINFRENSYRSWELWVWWESTLACAYIHLLRYLRRIITLFLRHLSMLIGKFSDDASPGGYSVNRMGNAEPNQYWLLKSQGNQISLCFSFSEGLQNLAWGINFFCNCSRVLELNSSSEPIQVFDGSTRFGFRRCFCFITYLLKKES